MTERMRDFKTFDGYGGSILVYDLERSYLFDADCKEDIDENWLREKGLLTDCSPPDKCEALDAPIPQITDVSIDLPGACNMGCTYCFEKPLLSRIGAMSDEVLEKTLEFTFEAAKGAPHVVIHFGSGEPIIAFEQLKRLVKRAQHYGRSSGQKISFELTTNATLVTKDVADFLAANPFNVRVSCDGPFAVHDRYRPMANGRPSYPLVERGLKLILETMGDRLTVNSVFCSGTRLRDLWAWAKDIGIRHFHAIKVGSEDDDNAALADRDVQNFVADTRMISDEIHEKLLNNERPVDYHPLTKTVRRMMLPQPITRFCGVAGSYVGVAADGRIYPCFRHLGLEEYELGHVTTGVDDEKRRSYRAAQAAEVDKRPICSKCWARYICGGGCYADSVVYSQTPLEPQTTHCAFWRAEIEEGIRLYDRLRRTDPRLCLALFNDDVEDILVNAKARILEQKRTF